MNALMSEESMMNTNIHRLLKIAFATPVGTHSVYGLVIDKSKCRISVYGLVYIEIRDCPDCSGELVLPLYFIRKLRRQSKPID